MSSRTRSLVPMGGVPLNIMCSKRWAMPVMPGRSLELPTWATQPPAMVGSSWRSTRRTDMPLARVFWRTGTFWAGGEPSAKKAGLGSHGLTRTNTDGHGHLASLALLGAQAVEALGEAALLQERLFQGGELAIQKIATHVQEGERGIGDELGGGGHGRTRTSTDEHGRTWTCLGGGHYGPLSFVLYPGLDLVNGGAAPGLKAEERGVPWRPLFKTPVPEKVLVVAAEFLETGAGDVGELELGLFRSAAGLASLGDVFAAAARGLNHLVV